MLQFISGIELYWYTRRFLEGKLGLFDAV